MTHIRLDYVHEFLDRHGRVRRYFRRSAFRQVPLTGLPGSAEFLNTYQMALAGRRRTKALNAGVAAGVSVARLDIDRDGKITVIIGRGTAETTRNEWGQVIGG